MPPVWLTWLATLLCTMSEQGAVVQDAVRAQYYEAVGAARAEGLLALVARLDAAATAFPASRFTPRLQETIHVIGILHPGSVPDRASRLQRLREQAAGNAETAAAVSRIEILGSYFAAAARGRPEEAEAGLLDPVLADWPIALQARADAAFRSGSLSKARALAEAAIEADPSSPLLASNYVLLALCDASTGNRAAAARHLHRALSVSPLPTIYGRTQDYVLLLSRFVRPVPGQVGAIYDETSALRLSGGDEIKDPRSMAFRERHFLLLDREQMLTVSPEGKVLGTRLVRHMEDFAAAPTGTDCYVAEDSVDLGSGTLVKVPATIGGRKKTLGQIRSIDIDARGDVYLLDQDAGVFRLPAGTTVSSATPVASVRGRQLRVDRRGYVYVLGADERSIQILSRQGKTLSSAVVAGVKPPVVEHFALDLLNNLYVLDSANHSIQIFAVNDTERGVVIERIATVPLEPKPQYRNLKVLAVAPTGELVAIGKNDNNWVLYR